VWKTPGIGPTTSNCEAPEILDMASFLNAAAEKCVGTVQGAVATWFLRYERIDQAPGRCRSLYRAVVIFA
jgi:hypothetical protein